MTHVAPAEHHGPAILADRYRLHEVLACVGRATVYRATDVKPRDTHRRTRAVTVVACDPKDWGPERGGWLWAVWEEFKGALPAVPPRARLRLWAGDASQVGGSDRASGIRLLQPSNADG